MKSKSLFQSLGKALESPNSAFRETHSKINARCLIELSTPTSNGGGEERKSWLLCLTPEKSAVEEIDAASQPEFDAKITMKDDDFYELACGNLSGQRAFMGGKMKIKGNMMLVGKLEPVLKQAMKAKL